MKASQATEPEWVSSLRSWIVQIVRAEVVAAVADATRPQEIFTVRDAAAFARVSTATIRGAIRDGRLIAHDVGRSLRIKRDDLERPLTPAQARAQRGQAWRAPIPMNAVPLKMTPEAAARLLKELAALQRGWRVPDSISPEVLAVHYVQLWRLRDLLKKSPLAMTPDDLRSLSAELDWLRYATSTTKS